MGQLGKEKRLREDRLVGIKTGVPSYIPPELETRGFKLVFYDVSDNKIGEIGSDSFRGKIAEVQFELISFGCGAFSFTINDLPDFNITYRTRVDIHSYFDSTPWFTGFIQVIPKPGKKRPYTFSGFGYFEQLDWVTITASYQNQEVSLIIKDIIQNYVAPNTQIIYNAAKIETTSYTITSIDFDHTKAKDALQTLADIAQGYEFGVDNSREFYFRAIDTETRYHYWVGKQFQDIEIEEDPNSVRNKLYVKAGQISGGSNIIGSVQDNTSISTYGLREDVITAPEILNSSDALQWANYILQDLKDPKVRAQIHNVFLDSTKEKIEPKGKCRITVYDGTEYELAVKRVLYSISKSGILAELELGTLNEPFEKQFVDLVKGADEERRLSDKRTEQLYDIASGGHQHVMADITDLDHDSLPGYVANEHIDWTNASQNLKTTGNVELNSWLIVNSGGRAGFGGLPNKTSAVIQAYGDIDTEGGVRFRKTDGSVPIVFYRGGTDFLILRQYSQDYNILQVWAKPGGLTDREATIALVRGDEPDVEYIDIYNNGYAGVEVQHGIRIQKRGSGSYRDFVFDQYDGTTKQEIMRLKSNRDVEIAQNLYIGGHLYLDNDKQIIFKDSGGAYRTALTLNSSNWLRINAPSGGRIQFEFGGTRLACFINNRFGLGKGASSPSYIISAGTENEACVLFTHAHSSNSAGHDGRLITRRSRGTYNSPSAVTNGDSLGRWEVSAHDGSTYLTTGRIVFKAEGTVSSGVIPTKMTILLMDSSGSLLEALKLDASGNLFIAGLKTAKSHPTNYRPVYVNIDTGELYRLA